MKFEEGKSVYPFGKKGIKEYRETLPVLEVKNKVVWINPNLDFPFKLQVGQPTNLGLFLNDALQVPAENSKRLEAENHHNRSLLLGRVIFGEKQGKHRQLFRDIDIKGSGYVRTGSEVSFGAPQSGVIGPVGGGEESWGIMYLEAANYDATTAESFSELGVRVSRTVAIVELEEIIYCGKRLAVSEAKARGLISKSATPTLEIRAFGTHARLKDIVSTKNSQEKKNALIKDARLLVAQELGKDPKEFDNFKYALWLAKTIGENIGLMGKGGYVHKYLGIGHNITLDGCIVDFDSVEKTKVLSDKREDYFEARGALMNFLEHLLNSDYGNSPEIKGILQEYENAYDAAIKD